MISLTMTDGAMLAAVTLLASVIQAATGFGFAMMAVPMFLLILDSVAAIQITIIVTLAISLVLLPRIYREASRPLVTRLIVGSALGFPLGMAAYLYASIAMIKIAVGVVILVFAGQMLLARNSATAPARRVATGATGEVGTGLISGAMASCLAMPGPAILLYLTHAGVEKSVMRASTLTVFVFSYGGALALQAAYGEVAGETWITAGWLIPVALIGAVIGHVISGRLSERLFRSIVLVILVATGAYMTAATLLS